MTSGNSTAVNNDLIQSQSEDVDQRAAAADQK